MTDKYDFHKIGQILMYAFKGFEPTASIKNAIQEKGIAGVTFFRPFNLKGPSQTRALTMNLQQTAQQHGVPKLLIAADQEGGQLIALGDGTTPFPGNMALGATQDPMLAERVGRAIGTELAAVGININYAPVADISSEPKNPSVGLRSFGDEPALVADMVTAFVQGVQSAGVAATAKHFPGSGEAAVDPHYHVPVIECTREELHRRELKPFTAAIKRGVKLLMTGHIAVPEITGNPELPATLSAQILDELLRDELSFTGLVISDAMEMGAIAQGDNQVIDMVAAFLAGVDLLLLNDDTDVQNKSYWGLRQALHRRLIPKERFRHSLDRLNDLRTWLVGFEQPPLEVVNCKEHNQLASEVAQRAITLVKDERALLPLRLGPDRKIAVVVPDPVDLTPADTSSYETIDLDRAIKKYHPSVEQINVPHYPDEKELRVIKMRLTNFDLVIACSINAHMNDRQADLMNMILTLEKPVVAVALRTPYDLMVYPGAATYVCSYGILQPSVQSLVDALFGKIAFSGVLPVTIPDHYPCGFRLEK
jgi:beta-N-acetylhexosaminidase